jgi:hypothetical protein
MGRLGHTAISCDLKPAEGDRKFSEHWVTDALAAMRFDGCLSRQALHRWDIIIMHPDCTFLSGSGIHWNNRGRGWEKTDAALQHVRECMDTATRSARIGWALENPVGIIGTRICEAAQWVQPYQFGDDASKTTGLWLKGLKRLNRDWDWVAPRWVCPKCKKVMQMKMPDRLWQASKRFHPVCQTCEGIQRLKPRWANQTDSGQNRLGPSESRKADRARTYPGIARAMANSWGVVGGRTHE